MNLNDKVNPLSKKDRKVIRKVIKRLIDGFCNISEVVAEFAEYDSNCFGYWRVSILENITDDRKYIVIGRRSTYDPIEVRSPELAEDMDESHKLLSDSVNTMRNQFPNLLKFELNVDKVILIFSATNRHTLTLEFPQSIFEK